ncbi:MAG: hypothetical protein QF464_05780 [Myxococcota bacterium]|jgi:hypothetical protein|nr:hypothetical protein [Myxococcota bacterium]
MSTDVTNRSAWRQLLPQGLTGHHALFEPELVRFSMGRSDEPTLDSGGATRLQSVLAAVEGAQNVAEGRDWIAGAPLAVQETLVRAYFATLFDYLDRHTTLAN